MTGNSNGGFIGINAPVGANGGPGVWSINDAGLLAKDNKWPSFQHEVVTTGASNTTVTDGGVTYKVHTFSAPGTITVNRVGYGVPDKLDYLVVAAGGAGYALFGIYDLYTNGGAGGGAGGMRQGAGPAGLTLTTGTFPVTVGVANGGPSVLTWSPAPVSCTGGGNAGNPTPNPPAGPAAGSPGGSGGGGGALGPPPAAGTTSGGSGISGEGFPGGNGGLPVPAFSGGGGGGAGGAGTAGGPAPATTPTRGAGGIGSPSTISGTNITYATGGASAVYTGGANPTTAGSGGWGNGGSLSPTGMNGQNGIVIVRYVVI